MIIKTNIEQAKNADDSTSAHNRRRVAINKKLAVDKQPDTKITIDQMRTIPDYQEDGIARRAVVMQENADLKDAINAAETHDELKRALIDAGII